MNQVLNVEQQQEEAQCSSFLNFNVKLVCKCQDLARCQASSLTAAPCFQL